MIDPLISNILLFWFSDAVQPLWFQSTDEFDNEIKTKYEKNWQQASRGELDHWQETADGAVALVIMLDQFPLNMYRGQGLRYSTEAKAREIAQYAIDHELDKELSDRKKAFLYLPFMHSEDIKDQHYSIELFDKAGLTENAKYARHHFGIVERFGRFPHRNVDLGRTSTEEELEYLKKANW